MERNKHTRTSRKRITRINTHTRDNPHFSLIHHYWHARGHAIPAVGTTTLGDTARAAARDEGVAVTRLAARRRTRAIDTASRSRGHRSHRGRWGHRGRCGVRRRWHRWHRRSNKRLLLLRWWRRGVRRRRPRGRRRLPLLLRGSVPWLRGSVHAWSHGGVQACRPLALRPPPERAVARVEARPASLRVVEDRAAPPEPRLVDEGLVRAGVDCGIELLHEGARNDATGAEVRDLKPVNRAPVG